MKTIRNRMLLLLIISMIAMMGLPACSSGGADAAEPDDSRQTEGKEPYEIVLERAMAAYNNHDAEEIWEMHWISLAPSYERDEYISAYSSVERLYEGSIVSIESVQHLSADEIEDFLQTEEAEALRYDIETLEEKGILKAGDITEAYVVITKEHYESLSGDVDDDDLEQKQFICCVNGKWTIGEYLGEPGEC